jgi:uncharacterized protein
MRNPFLLLLFLVPLIIYAGLCTALFLFQRSFIYFPQPRSLGEKTSAIEVPVNGADLIVTVRPQNSPNALIYFGGNAEDVSRRLVSFSAAFPEQNLYLLHYRGYGGSSGKPSEAALFSDAIALFDKVHAQYPNITVVGRSLGSGIAIYLASRRPVSRLILVTPYDSILKLAAQQLLYFPVSWLLMDKYESWKYAKLIKVPTLLIAAENDEVIPKASTESLLAHFRAGVASIRFISGTSHNTISDSPEYIFAIKSHLYSDVCM